MEKEDAQFTASPDIRSERTHDRQVKLPGPDDYVRLISVDAGAKTVPLGYEGPKFAGAVVEQGRSLTVIAEGSIKPGMTLLW